MTRWRAALALVLLCVSTAFATVVTDDFNRPDNFDLGTSWTPQREGASAQIVSQRVRSSALGNGIEESYSATMQGDQFARVQLANFFGSGYGDAGVYVRAALPPERTFVVCTATKNTNGTVIALRNQGLFTELASETNTQWLSGDVIELAAAGPNYTCKRNGQPVLVATDGTLTNGRAGIRLREDLDLSNTELDGFIAGDIGQGILEASWTEPITNTDNSALTDLGSYKIYFARTATGTPPCPSPDFFVMPAPLATPPPNSTLTFQITGLLAGEMYRAMVTAINTSGAESNCGQPSNDAVARFILPSAITGTLVH